MADHETTLRELAELVEVIGSTGSAACLAGAEALRREREADDDPMVCQFCSFTLAECLACKANGSLACCPECRHRAALGTCATCAHIDDDSNANPAWGFCAAPFTMMVDPAYPFRGRSMPLGERCTGWTAKETR